MSRRIVAFLALAAALGAVFVWLGFWQLDRRDERRALNDARTRQLSLPPVPVTDLVSQQDAVDRRASVSGVPDLENEIVLTGRSRSGSPGVHILTPVRLPGRDTAVLVNRGWVYSADATTVDLRRWRETRMVFNGFTQRLPGTKPTGAPPRGRAVRQLSYPGIARLLPYPVHSLYVVAQDSAASDSTPARLESPLLGDGPHLSYAIQWFSFAAIAIIGAAAVAIRGSHASRGGAQLATEATGRKGAGSKPLH